MVTGAGKGIGREIVKHLVACGASVVAVSRTESDLSSLKAEVPCETITADLADAAACRRAGEQAGAIDLLVNNAGISIPQPLLDTTVDAFDRTMHVNVRAVLLITQVIAKGMIARGRGGAIVNLSSQASMAALADHAAYCASKGARHADQGDGAGAGTPPDPRERREPDGDAHPHGRDGLGRPEEERPDARQDPAGAFAKPFHVAQAVAYLLSDQSDMIHGVTLPIDGGFLAT